MSTTYLHLLKAATSDLPAEETDASVLYSTEIHTKISDWQKRSEIARQQYEDLEIPSEFMELMAKYPVSMCKREMTDTLKLLIALFYYFHPIGLKILPRSMLTEECEDKISDEKLAEMARWVETHYLEVAQPSYDHLAAIFDRPKASIFAAIHQKETQANQLIEQCQMRRIAHNVAFDQLVAQEKEKLLSEQDKRENQPNNRTNVHSATVVDI